MLTFEQPLLLLLFLPIGILVYLTWQRMALPYAGRQRRMILASRLLLFSCIILALAGTALTLPVTHQTTIFVGDISASTTAQRSFIEQWINDAVKHKQADDRVGIVAVGRNALVEQSVQANVDFSHFESTPDTNYTDIAAGLRLASAIMPSDSQRHIILLSDGQQNMEDALQEAQLLQQQGIRLDIVPLPSASGPDVRIDGFNAPTNLHSNEHFQLHVRIYSSSAQKASIHIYMDQSLIAQQSIALTRGEQDISLNMLAPSVGFHTFRATLTAPQDAIAQNDEGAAFVNVQGPPRVLVVEGTPGSGQNIVAALKATHINVDVGAPGSVPSTLDGLVPYSSIILADVPAVELGTTRMQMLQTFVRDLGHGLIVSGGQNSYGVGGYANTPLEQTLPVSMEIPQHKDTPTIAVVLIVESLEGDAQINISKEATKEVVGLLSPRDQVGISAGFGTLSIKMQHVTNKQEINRQVDAMNPTDPASYNPDFQNAEQELLHTNAKIKHIILLGDGDAYDNYAPEVTKLANENITVSTVETNALGPEDIATMQNIAQWGKGRFYRADNPSAIPQILLKEAQRAAKRSLINDTFTPAVVSNHPILTGFNGFPQLNGYVATTPKSAAQMVLVSHLDDPVLATWQYGLGRSVAWTSDALGLWSKNWLTWNDAARWWANVVTWTLPSADQGGLNVNGSVTNSGGQITVDLPSGTTIANGQAQAQVQAHIINPDLSQQNVTLQPTAPDRWTGNFPAEQVGAYLLRITYQGADKNAGRLSATSGLVVPYSPEFHTQGTDLRYLKLLAQSGSGSLLDPANKSDAFAQSLKPAQASLPLTFWLLALAALLLPLDIALRRLSSAEFLRAGYYRLRHPFQASRAEGIEHAIATSVSTANASLHQVRQRRMQIRNRANTTQETTPSAARQNASAQGRSATSPAPTKTTNVKQPSITAAVVPKPAHKPDTPTAPAATTAKLLEAKRKRRENK